MHALMTGTEAFEWIVKIAADDVTQLRAIDVDRVLDTAMDQIPASLTEFVGWLTKVRPDLEERIEWTLDELVKLQNQPQG